LAKRNGPTKQPLRSPLEAEFHTKFREDLRFWVETDRRIALRVLELVESTLREPFAGVGKPEPLKHELAGAWSRRITGEHRLVYLVKGNRVEFLQARYHY
jgi:toxin YoeB